MGSEGDHIEQQAEARAASIAAWASGRMHEGAADTERFEDLVLEARALSGLVTVANMAVHADVEAMEGHLARLADLEDEFAAEFHNREQ